MIGAMLWGAELGFFIGALVLVLFGNAPMALTGVALAAYIRFVRKSR